MDQSLLPGEDTHLVIWTTTPWSIAGNRAVCYNPRQEYAVARAWDGNNYLLMEKCLDSSEVKEFLGADFEIVKRVKGSELEGMSYRHPLYSDRTCPLLPGSHVTSDAGTGLVHTAPAHGPDDHRIGLENGLDLSCPVDENGRFGPEAGLDLGGLEVLGEGSRRVIEVLGPAVLRKGSFVHSYPCDWRTKKPVILRASMQWFISVESLKDGALEALKEVPIRPESSKSGFQVCARSLQ